MVDEGEAKVTAPNTRICFARTEFLTCYNKPSTTNCLPSFNLGLDSL